MAFVRSASSPAEGAAPPGPEGAPDEFSDLYVLRLSNSVAPIASPKRLTFDHRFTGRPAWTADGPEVVYCSGTHYSQSLWRISADGSGKAQLLASLGNGVSDAAISRDGGRLAYMRRFYDTNIWRVKVPGLHNTTRASSIGAVPFIFSTREDAVPQFSPDGNRIVFVSARSSRPDNYEIFVCASDGSNVLQLTSVGALAGAPQWSPDGERIAFDSQVEGNWAIYVISANGGKPRRVTTDTANDDSPSWSRDGRWIYFASNRTGEDQVWKIPAQGGEAVQVTRKGGVIGFESPDGKVLYYAKGRHATSLWKVPVDGGEEAQVLESLVSAPDFAVVAAGIYFMPAPLTSNAVSFIQFYSFATGKISLIATTGNRAENGLTISPDGQWILFTQFDHSATELMLVENFR
jgi:Tol biopolymer transport system component